MAISLFSVAARRTGRHNLAKRKKIPPRFLKTHCPKGHDYSDEDGGRYENGQCRACRREYSRTRALKAGGWQAVKKVHNSPKTGTCDPWTPTITERVLQLYEDMERVPTHWDKKRIQQQIDAIERAMRGQG